MGGIGRIGRDVIRGQGSPTAAIYEEVGDDEIRKGSRVKELQSGSESVFGVEIIIVQE